MKKRLLYLAGSLAVTAIVGISYAQQPQATENIEIVNPQEEDVLDIIDTAAGNEIFSTLVAAVKAADLVDTLKGDGPFTVLAPSNEAFEKLPEGTVERLLEPRRKQMLIAILKHHVVSGKLMSKDVVELESAESLLKQKIKIRTEDGNVMLGKAKVVKANVECSNGVIHVVDTVIMPNLTPKPIGGRDD